MFEFLPEAIRPYAAWASFSVAMLFALALVRNLWYGLIDVRRPESTFVSMSHFVAAIANCYGFGLLMKVSGFGPEFFRYWLADIGFPLAIALLVLRPFMRGYLGDAPFNTYKEELIYKIAETKFALKFVLVTFGAAVCYEIVAGIIVRDLRESGRITGPSLIGGFDPIDVLMYALGAGLGTLCWRIGLRALRSTLADHNRQLKSEQRQQAQVKGTGARKSTKRTSGKRR
jgi:hypothetical protein